MPHVKKTIKYRDGTIEVEKYYTARYGLSVERGVNRVPTPEDVAKVNMRNAVKKIKRLILNNFTSDDWSVTLTYSKDSRPDIAEARKILSNFKARVKRAYAKEGVEFMWIETTEYESKSIHHHMIINECNRKALQIIKSQWKCGHIHCSPLWDNGEVEGLAEYYVKETKRTSKKPKGERIRRTLVSHSRNLVMPKTTVKIVSANKWRAEPKAPHGYYIDKNSLYEGVNEITGYRFQYYTLKVIKTERMQI